MNGINGLYIINFEGGLIYWQENISQNSEKIEEEIDYEHITSLISTLEVLALEIGEKDVKILMLGYNRYLVSKDKLTDITFILKCNKNVNSKKIFHLLNQIKNTFIDNFTGSFNSPQIDKVRIMKSFINSLYEIIGEAKQVQYFLDSLKIQIN